MNQLLVTSNGAFGRGFARFAGASALSVPACYRFDFGFAWARAAAGAGC